MLFFFFICFGVTKFAFFAKFSFLKQIFFFKQVSVALVGSDFSVILASKGTATEMKHF